MTFRAWQGRTSTSKLLGPSGSTQEVLNALSQSLPRIFPSIPSGNLLLHSGMLWDYLGLPSMQAPVIHQRLLVEENETSCPKGQQGKSKRQLHACPQAATSEIPAVSSNGNLNGIGRQKAKNRQC